jgi:hypothetical protein
MPAECCGGGDGKTWLAEEIHDQNYNQYWILCPRAECAATFPPWRPSYPGQKPAPGEVGGLVRDLYWRRKGLGSDKPERRYRCRIGIGCNIKLSPSKYLELAYQQLPQQEIDEHKEAVLIRHGVHSFDELACKKEKRAQRFVRRPRPQAPVSLATPSRSRPSTAPSGPARPSAQDATIVSDDDSGAESATHATPSVMPAQRMPVPLVSQNATTLRPWHSYPT